MDKMSINETDVISAIKYHIVKHLLDGEFWHADRLIAYMSAIIFPFLGRVRPVIGEFSIQILCGDLEKFFRCRSSVKKRLLTISFDEVVDFFLKEFCPTKKR